MKNIPQNRGFTLLELLVVISCIVLLLSIVLPAIYSLRFIGNVAICTSNVRQWNQGFLCYANDNGGYFPRFDPAMATGHNANEAGYGFTDALLKYGIGVNRWFCPLCDWSANDLNTWYCQFQPTMYRLAYSWYVPRVDTDGYMHPCAGYPTKIGGPSCPLANMPAGSPTVYSEMPLVSCIIMTSAGTPNPPTSAFIQGIGYDTSTITSNGGGFHVRYGTIVNTNVGYPDGHAETRPVGNINNYWFGGGGWWTFY